MTDVRLSVWRGDASGGAFVDYTVPADEGMVVLDVVHRIQATEAPDLAVRWNCKAGKCGSCSAEINGHPKLMCMTRMNTFAPGEEITVSPLKTFPVVKDLVTDVSFNYEKARASRHSSRSRRKRTARAACTRRMSSACRSSISASSASSARTSVT